MVQAVERAMALLERLDAAGPEGLGLRELAGAVGLKPPTAHHLVRTLEALGYVAQDRDSRRYRLGPRAVTLGQPQAFEAVLTRVAAGPVSELQERLNETVVLAVYHDRRRLTLLSAESQEPLRVVPTRGQDDRLYHTATGRVLLSGLEEAELEAVEALHGALGGLGPTELRRELRRIRETGNARYEPDQGHVVAVAVPVALAPRLGPVALGVYLPAARYSAEREAELLRALRETAARIAAAYERVSP